MKILPDALLFAVADLDDLFLQFFALGDVPRDLRGADDPAVGVANR